MYCDGDTSAAHPYRLLSASRKLTIDVLSLLSTPGVPTRPRGRATAHFSDSSSRPADNRYSGKCRRRLRDHMVQRIDIQRAATGENRLPGPKPRDGLLTGVHQTGYVTRIS